jgi:hypothetical protein
MEDLSPFPHNHDYNILLEHNRAAVSHLSSLHHMDIPGISCQICNIVLRNHFDLNNHIASTHIMSTFTNIRTELMTGLRSHNSPQQVY